MVGGTYYTAVGHLPAAIVLASIPYALLCTAVLMGKHIDKIAWDTPDGTRTIPVVIGERRARQATLAMMVAFYPLVVVLVILGTTPIASLVCLFGVTRLVKIWGPFSRPKPDGSATRVPDLAAVVRRARVRAYPPRRRAARARHARRCDRRLLSAGWGEPAPVVCHQLPCGD